MQRRKYQNANRRRTRIQPLEQRLNLATYIDYGFRVEELSDDGAVVSIDSQENVISILANDARQLRQNYEEGQITLTQPEHGSVSLTELGTVLYTPDDGFEGIDRFTYSRSSVDSPANVYVNVIKPIYALRDWFRVDEDSSNHLLDVLRNDSATQQLLDQTHSDLRIVSVTEGDQGGTIAIAAGGRELIYTPAAGTEGQETFRYTIETESGFTSEASVIVQVTTLDASTQRHVFPEQFKQIQLDAAAQRDAYSHGGYRTASYFSSWRNRVTDATSNPVFASTIALPRAADESVSTSTAFSATNNQHFDVDEGDVVKTDGDFLYLVSNWTDDQGHSRHELVIGDVRDPTAPVIKARVMLDGDVLELHLVDNRVVVLSESGGKVTATTLDVSEPAVPQVISESKIAGAYQQSRQVGDHVYLVVGSASPLNAPLLEEVCFEEGEGCFFETAEQYFERVMNDAAFGRPPEITTLNAFGEVVSTLTPAVEASQTASITRLSASTIISLDVSVDGTGASDAYSFLHDPNTQIYVSPESFYFFSAKSRDTGAVTNAIWFSPDGGFSRNSSFEGAWSQETIIEKVSFDEEGQLDWVASGIVKGSVASPFSLSEHEGYLRVATGANGNSVYVLAEEGEELNVVGSVEDLAYGERIYSVRFKGDRGFVVTYRKVDPLFVIDFSNPTAPELLGELKITGYSNYLHVIDENHLLGIGREANGGGLFQEMQVTVFDISDLANPQLKHRYSFEGGRKLWSPIMRDAWNLGSHQSVSYFASHETLVIPYYEGDRSGWSWLQAGETAEVSMRVLDIDLEDGITALGTVDFDNAFDPHLARSVRIGDTLASVSPTAVLLNELRDPDQSLGSLLIESEATDDQLATRGSDRVMIDVLQNDRIDQTESVSIDITQPTQGGTAEVTDDNQVEFEPTPGFVGAAEFEYVIDRQGRQITAAVRVEVKRSWHNQEQPMDVDQNGRVAPLDLLRVVNLIGEHGAVSIETLDTTAGDAVFADVNNDGRLSPRDALLMVNHMSERKPMAIIDRGVEEVVSEANDAEATLF